MEEQKTENKEELQQETTEEKNSSQGNSSTRSSLLWIFAGGYLVYTGTHDNETTRGWFRNLSQHDRNFAKAYIGCEGKHETAAVWSLIRAAMSSVADRCVIPVQDYLCLGNEARINEPSTLGDNWKWRMKKGQLNEKIIEKIYKMTKLYGRLVKEEQEKTEADVEMISDK